MLTAFVILLEAGALVWLGFTFPATPPPLDAGRPLAQQIERVERELMDRLPPLTHRLAGSPLWLYHHDVEVAHRDADPAARARRVDSLNRAIARVRESYLGAVTLLAATLLAGALALTSTALRRPTSVSLLAPLACGLAVAPILTEPLLGADYGATLLPFVLPMLLGGAAVLWLERATFRAPARRLGVRLGGSPAALALLSAALLGVLGAAGVLLGLDERLHLLTRVGVVLLANALVHLGIAGFLGVRALARLRRRRREPAQRVE